MLITFTEEFDDIKLRNLLKLYQKDDNYDNYEIISF